MPDHETYEWPHVGGRPLEGLLSRPQDGFVGNPEDLERFAGLAESPIRSPARAEAMAAWSEYRLGRQLTWSRARDEQGLLTKGGYIQALTARVVDLRGANLDGMCLGYVDLRGVILDDASLRGAWLKGAKLENASLARAHLDPLDTDGGPRDTRLLGSDLRQADFSGADLRGADLSGARLEGADLRRATLRGSDLQNAVFVGSDLRGADLSGSRVFGVTPWNVRTGREGESGSTIQRDLVITPTGETDVAVDEIEVAQIMHLFLQNVHIPKLLNTLTGKAVLILGRFTPERKRILEAIRGELRSHGLVPVLFDFERPARRNFTETVVTLAGLSHFIIVDITNPSSAPLELQATVPTFRVPVVPILQKGEPAFSMFTDLAEGHGERYGGHVMALRVYPSEESLVRNLRSDVIDPARALAEKLASRKGGPADRIELDP